MYYTPSQYLMAESELTKLYPHKILYWMNDITTFNQKRQSCSNTKWASLKMSEVQLFLDCLLTNERPWYHSGTERLWYTKDYFHFYPQIFPCLLAIPLNWKWGDGTSAHLAGVSLTVMLTTRAVLFLRCITITCFYATEVCFTCGLRRKKIYSAHTLEWHTWFCNIPSRTKKKHLKFLESEGSVLSITLILEIDYKS